MALYDVLENEVSMLAVVTEDTDGLEEFCIKLGDRLYHDVSLGFQYTKGSEWNERKYGGLQRAAIDNIDLVHGNCHGKLVSIK